MEALFKHNFGIKGEEIRKGLKIYGNVNVEFDVVDDKVSAVYVETKIGANPQWLKVDLSLPCTLDGIYTACERHLTDIRQENH